MGSLSITYDDAVKALKYISTFEELAALIAKIDATGTGTNTLLYSGAFSADMSTNDLAKGMVEHDLIPTANIGQLTNIQFLLQTAQG